MIKLFKHLGITFIILLVLVLASTFTYNQVTGKNLLKITAAELIPNFSFKKITRDFDTQESEHISWYFPNGVKPSSDDISKMEKAYTDACEFWGIEATEILGEKIRFAWLPGESKYDTSLYEKSLGKSSNGRAFPKDGILYSIFSYTPHELNHVIAGQINNSIKLLDEGFADYLNKKNWYTNTFEVLVNARNNNKLIPIKNMLSCKDFYSQDSRLAYAEASLFTQFLVNEKGLDNYKTLYEKLNFREKEEVIISTFEEVYGIKLDKLIEEWELYLNFILDQ